MATLVVALLAAGALAYVAGALAARSRVVAEVPSPVAEARAAKRAALVAIVDLEDERAVGKLADEDFNALVGAYERDAVAAMRRLDDLAAPGHEDDLEVEIAAARRLLECPVCGAARPAGSACPRCGG